MGVATGSQWACLSLPVVDADVDREGGISSREHAGALRPGRCWAPGQPAAHLGTFVLFGARRGWAALDACESVPRQFCSSAIRVTQSVDVLPLQAANLGAPSPNPCPALPLTTELAIDRPFSRRSKHLGSSSVVNWACLDVWVVVVDHHPVRCRPSSSLPGRSLLLASHRRLSSRHSTLSIATSPTQPCRLQSAAAGQTTSRSTRMAPQQKTPR